VYSVGSEGPRRTATPATNPHYASDAQMVASEKDKTSEKLCHHHAQERLNRAAVVLNSSSGQKLTPTEEQP
jgi:hypothetical protein